MTREELYQSIYSSDVIYLPNHEEGSAPLEVASGCSWHKCEFCDFARDPFRTVPLEQVEYNAQVLGQLKPESRRLFLLGQNALMFSCEHLCGIIDLVNKYMPAVEQIAMYGRVDDIMRKSDEELRLLKARGVSTVHIGVESGCDQVLQYQNKGVTSAETIAALRRLDAAGIEYYVTIVLGLGGKACWKEHAIETAALLNQVHPKNIWCMKLKLWEDTPLYEKAQRGDFQPLTDLEILDEELLMLENLTVEDCLFEDTTVLNTYTVKGMLSEEKAVIMKAIEYLKTGGRDLA